MMTQTHTLVAATLFMKPERSIRQNTAILLGSLAPDAAVFGLFIWSKFAGIPERQLWREIYFTEPMLSFTAIGNSLPLYFLIFLIGVFWFKYANQNMHTDKTYSFQTLATSSAIGLFALAAITHLIGDFPVHVADAHPHFWPITDWRFESVVSYWDRRHHGGTFRIFEAIAGVLLSVILFRRFKSKWVRAFTLIAIAAYVAVPLYFYFAVRLSS